MNALLPPAHATRCASSPGDELWDEALRKASFVVAHQQFLGEAAIDHADVVFPAESYAEKEGTVTHPDGRLQRLRPAIGHPGEVRAEWQVLAEIAAAARARRAPLGDRRRRLDELAEEVPIYAGITLDEIGGRGVRWQERPAGAEAARAAFGNLGFGPAAEPPAPLAAGDGALRLATRPGLWASWVTERSPSLRFLVAGQQVELSPLDAERLRSPRATRCRCAATATRSTQSSRSAPARSAAPPR